MDIHVISYRRRALRILQYVACVAALAGCESSNTTPPEPPTPTQASAPRPRVSPGRLVGNVKIGSDSFDVTGLLSPTGALRMYIGRPTEIDYDSGSSLQLIAAVELQGAEAVGTGVVIGQGCSLPTPNRFCGIAAASSIKLTATGDTNLTTFGDLRVEVGGTVENWPLKVGYWGGQGIFDPITEWKWLEDHYEERLAEFAQPGDVVMSVNGAGRLFFQSPGTGCTGNGFLTPSSDGKINLFNVALTIANCRAPYVFLNTELTGLSVFEAATPWDYGYYFLKMWLSTDDNVAAPAAITFWAEPVSR